MSDALEKAVREAVEAAKNSEQLDAIRNDLIAQAVTRGLQSMQQPTCQHHQPQQDFSAKKWLVIGGVVVSAGLVGAMFAVAIAIGATCATACLLILRSMWRDFQKGN
ncbi:hypothetical protein RM704_15625 [Streptomyces sp. DSM 3412]|uniref:DUF3040 domain-containing protein n=1 Tax=Streptomyces gottesmaniae TaxID=3075518 RepID=A0ABU2YX29_9ACTN|nr:hypothetical protein [Streptomyces sp. DSM 3412]MDT0568882.1 hypothetical protein [Streptomyces sp. DSM 3412]